MNFHQTFITGIAASRAGRSCRPTLGCRKKSFKRKKKWRFLSIHRRAAGGDGYLARQCHSCPVSHLTGRYTHTTGDFLPLTLLPSFPRNHHHRHIIQFFCHFLSFHCSANIFKRIIQHPIITITIIIIKTVVGSQRNLLVHVANC